MGLAETIQNAAQTAIKALGNLPVVVIYTSGTYTNGQLTGTVTLTVSAIRLDYDVSKIDGVNVLVHDRQYLIAGRAFGAVVPTKDDTITIGADVWTVKRVTTDPASAAWLLQVRK